MDYYKASAKVRLENGDVGEMYVLGYEKDSEIGGSQWSMVRLKCAIDEADATVIEPAEFHYISEEEYDTLKTSLHSSQLPRCG